MITKINSLFINRKPWRIAFSKREQAITCLASLLATKGYSISAAELRKGRNINYCQFVNLESIASEHGFGLEKVSVGLIDRDSSKKALYIANLKTEGTCLIVRKSQSYIINNPYSSTCINSENVTNQLQEQFVLRLKSNQVDTKIRKRIKPSFMFGALTSEKSLILLAATIILLSILHGTVALIDPIIKNVYFTNVIQLGITDWARALAILYFTVAVIGAFILVGSGALSLLLTCRLSLKWAYNSFTSVLRVTNNYLEIRSKGDLMNRIRSSERLGSFIGSDEIMLIGSMFNLIILIFVLISTSVPLALMMILLQIGATYFVIATTRGWKTRADDLQQRSAQEAGSFVNVFSKWESIHQYKAENSAFRMHQLVVNKRIRSQQRMSIYSIWVQFGSSSIDTVQSVVLLTYASILIMQGAITLGEYIAFQAILGSVLAPIKRLSKFISSLQSVRATSERIEDIIEEASLQSSNGIQKAPDGIMLCIKKKASLIRSSGDDGENLINIQKDGKVRELLLNNRHDIDTLEELVSGDKLTKSDYGIYISHTLGSRDLLVARQKPYIYDATVAENIRLGLSSSDLKQSRTVEELASVFRWGQDKLYLKAQEIRLSNEDLHLIGILRALWRKPSGILMTVGDDKYGDHQIALMKKVVSFAQLENIQIIYMTNLSLIAVNTIPFESCAINNVEHILLDSEHEGGSEQ